MYSIQCRITHFLHSKGCSSAGHGVRVPKVKLCLTPGVGCSAGCEALHVSISGITEIIPGWLV